MLKKMVLTAIIFSLLTAMNFSFADGLPKIYYNDIEVSIKNNFGKQFINNNGVTMVPLEGFMTYFGTEIDYLRGTGNVAITKGPNKLEFIPGESYFLKNGFKILLEESTIDDEKDVYIPLRRVMEVMGREVIWNSEKMSIQINSDVDMVNDIRNSIMPLETLGVKGKIIENRLEFMWPESSEADYYLLYLLKEDGKALRVSKPIFNTSSSHYRPGYFDITNFRDGLFMTFKTSSVIDGIESELSKGITIDLSK